MSRLKIGFLALLLVCAPKAALAYACFASIAGPDTGDVREIRELPEVGTLIRSEHGLFRLEAGATTLEAVAGPQTGSVFEIRELSDGRMLILAEQGWFRLEAGATTLEAVPGPEIGSVFEIRELSDGRSLILAEHGLFRVEAGATTLEAVPGPETGSVFEVRELSDGRWLTLAEQGLFRLEVGATDLQAVAGPEIGFMQEMIELSDGRVLIKTPLGLFGLDAEIATLEAVTGPELGFVFEVRELSDGRALVRAALGLFHLDTEAATLEVVTGPETGAVYVTRELADGGVLILAEDGWFRLEAGTLALKAVTEPATGSVFVFRELSDGRVLILAEQGLFRLDAETAVLEAVSGPETGTVEGIHEYLDGRVLILAEQGLFRLQTETAALELVAGPETGFVYAVRESPDGRALILAEQGLFHLEAEIAALKAVPGPETGLVQEVRELLDGRVLIWTERGLFRLDAEALALERVDGPETGSVQEIRELSDRRTLIWTDHGLFHLDSELAALEAVAGPETGFLRDIRELSDGRTLIWTDKGVFLTVQSFMDAQVTLENAVSIQSESQGEETIQTNWIVGHSCSMIAERLKLRVVAWLVDAKEKNEAPIRVAVPPPIQVQGGEARFSVNVPLPEEGKWSFQVVATTNGREIPIGSAVSFSTEEPKSDSLPHHRDLLVVGLLSLYLGAFAGLFIAARWNAWAFRILADPVWCRIGVWPFFVLRYWPTAQLWVLQSWFKAMRGTVRDADAYLDGTITGPDGVKIAASALPARLRNSPRLWLHGDAGMGKSETFEAWKRAYFSEDLPSLAAAVLRYGFVLNMLPVRQYANLPADPDHPERWLVEAVRRHLGQFGLVIKEIALVTAMLRSGRIALVLDGMNEADRDEALTAFSSAFPEVPLLVTSQNDGPESFATWKLPSQISDQAAELLDLWLGKKHGEILVGRIEAEGMMQFLQSGYDLRLIADIATIDPDLASLPLNRVGLYRAILGWASIDEEAPLPLEPLTDIALTMVIEKRRDLREADIASLGKGAVEALAGGQVRILRNICNVYEFEHDQMRAFLAALKLVEGAPNVTVVAKRLEEIQIWTCSRSDQEEVRRFLADLVHAL